jgi:hypothetical protein
MRCFFMVSRLIAGIMLPGDFLGNIVAEIKERNQGEEP